MLNSTFGLNKDYLKYIDKENSYQNNGEDTYNLIFINGATETFKKNGIKKAVINYIDLHKESLEISIQKIENASNQSESLQATSTEKEVEENKNTLAIFNEVPAERIKKLFTLENIEILEKIIANQRVAVLTGEPAIPDYYRKLSNDKNVSLRMNGDIYARMKKHSIDIGETIATIVNYLFDMYLNEEKK